MAVLAAQASQGALDAQGALGAQYAVGALSADGASVLDGALSADGVAGAAGVLRVAPELEEVLGLDQDFFCAAAKAGLVTGHQVASGAAEDLLAKLCAVCPSVCDARDELVPEGPSP